MIVAQSPQLLGIGVDEDTCATVTVDDGHEVLTMEKAAEIGDIFCTATGDKNVIARSHIIWLLVSAFVIGTICASMLVPLAPHPVSKSQTAPSAKILWRSPVFVAVLVACSLVQASHALYYGFSTIDWTAKGLSDTTIGALWALGVVVEILLFAASGLLSELIGPLAFVVIGAAGSFAAL